MENKINIINIRFATLNDLDQIIDLCELHAIFEKSEYDKTGKKEALQKQLFAEDPPLYCLVVEKNGNLLGYATYMKQFSTWDASFYIYMDCLFMKEEARGKRLGEMLVRRIQGEANKLSCSLIQWQTPKFNTRAIKFYERIGASALSKERFFLKSEKD